MAQLETTATKDPKPGAVIVKYGDMDGYAAAIAAYCQTTNPDGKVAGAVRAAHRARADGDFGSAFAALEDSNEDTQERGWKALASLVADSDSDTDSSGVVAAVQGALAECSPMGKPGIDVPAAVRGKSEGVRWVFHLLYAIVWGLARTDHFDSWLES